MRRLIAMLSTIATTVALGATLSSPAAAATGAGTYTAITPYRAADTRTGVHSNRKGKLGPAAVSQVGLTGYVPTTAAAAVVSLTPVAPTSTGVLQTYADGAAAPSTWSVYYRPGSTSTVTAIVPLKNARFSLRNSGAGSTDFLVDVVGYYGALGASGTSGVLTSLPNRRVLAATTVIGAGQSRNVPTGFVGTVFLQIHATNTTRNGSVAVYRTGGSVPTPSSFFYGIGAGYSASIVARTDTAGSVTVVNRGPAAIKLALDVSATFPGDSTVVAGGLQTVAPQRLVSARTLGAGKVTSVAVAGQLGVARANLGAVAVSVAVGAPSTAGQLIVGAPGRTTLATRSLSFGAGQSLGATVIVPVSSGAFEIRNGTTGSLQVYVDVVGYLPSNSLTPPASDRARYLANLTESGASGDNRSTLQGEGCTDAAAGTSFALLDVGAQSYRTPPLSTASPGVALANTRTVRLTYAQLVDAIEGYLDGAADSECNSAGRAVRVAVGTNNSGNFSDTSDSSNPPYSATQRGKDWFTGVIKPLQQYAATKSSAPITVVGANDIENDAASDFDPVYQNAKSWEDAYLAASASSTQDGRLVFNGAAIDCPAYFGDTTSVCNEGWTLSQFVALTTNQGRVQTLPQIYTAATAAQWTNVAAAAVKANKTIAFLGALTQHALDTTTYTADQGWAALNRGLSSVVDTPSVPRSVAFVD